MKLNAIEKALMNNPLRALVQRRYEAPLLERLALRLRARSSELPAQGERVLAGSRVLEVGCGRGVGTEIILERLGARHVSAFDLDPDMVAKARKRLAGYGPERVRLWVGDASSIAAEDASFDVVVDFAIIHHVPDWQAAVGEVRRVLKPGGLFLFEEVTRQALERWVYRTFLVHPTENRFSAAEFLAELERQGISVGEHSVEWLFGDFISGAGRKT